MLISKLIPQPIQRFQPFVLLDMFKTPFVRMVTCPHFITQLLLIEIAVTTNCKVNS